MQFHTGEVALSITGLNHRVKSGKLDEIRHDEEKNLCGAAISSMIFFPADVTTDISYCFERILKIREIRDP